MTAPAIRLPYLDLAADALLAAAPAPRRALFLDRDGVVNVNHGYVHAPARTDWVPGIFDLVADAAARGYLVIVATNQAGIARGLYDEATFLDYTAWMHREFSRRGTPLLATYWCPHHPEAGQGAYKVACACRKPAPGMLQAALARFSLVPEASFLVGDHDSDVLAAARAGVAGRRLDREGWGDAMTGLLAFAP